MQPEVPVAFYIQKNALEYNGMKWFKNCLFWWFVGGFGFGFLASVIYLLVEGPPIFILHYDFFEIMLYPGIESGWWFFEHVYSRTEFAAEAFGCGVNGLTYGVILFIVGLLVRKLRKRVQK
jgi:hypothetical protein